MNELVLVQGMSDTKLTLAEWNRNPWPVFRTWLLWSLAVALGLLCAVYVVASMSRPDPTPLVLPGVNSAATLGDARHVLFRNLLVLALHSMACVAGFMAGSTVPQQAALRNGFSRWIHEKAGKFAIAFVIGATTFSLSTQAYVLGHAASTVSAHLGIGLAPLLLALSLHALPELTALFLPLAAWVVASRRGDWHKLLAATVVTTAVSLPVLMISCLVEVYVTPHLILALR
ncbi:MAG: stage II sporulation protein M [Actinobacteria bacterium]|nr:stage II sporulation protein M [Actinomycetota bacterium]